MSMLFKISSVQVPLVWEAIKLAVVNSMNIQESHITTAFQRVLHRLLCGSMQCFITVSEEKILLQVLLTQIGVDNMTGCRELHMISVYSFQKATNEDKRQCFDVVMSFARSQQCEAVVCQSALPILWEMNQAAGMVETSRQFRIQVEG